MADIDDRINTIKNEHLEDLMTPCSVFMTFENEEGVNRAIEFNKTIDSNSELYGELGLWLDQYEIII